MKVAPVPHQYPSVKATGWPESPLLRAVESGPAPRAMVNLAG
jgi:hypothetical protein